MPVEAREGGCGVTPRAAGTQRRGFAVSHQQGAISGKPRAHLPLLQPSGKEPQPQTRFWGRLEGAGTPRGILRPVATYTGFSLATQNPNPKRSSAFQYP